jgi:crotonobetainyl-CoA:carnitine CoA-transferase CaiB-like acyl-CoA transferase
MLEPRCKALEGIRVLDLTVITAGAQATQMLGDMGAEIIKVESTVRPDTFRGRIFPNRQPGDRPWNKSVNFNTINRNKYGITLDLKKERGKELFLELVKISDVVSENFRMGVMESFGLDYPVLKSSPSSRTSS